MIHEYVYEWTKKIGPGKNYGLWMLYEPSVVVNDPNDLYYILGKQQHQFTKAKVYGEMLDWSIPHNMLRTDGEEWQKQRSTFNPFFHYTEIKNTQDHVYEETQIMCEVVDECISKNKPIDIALQFECLTLDVLGKTGFAFDFNAQRDNRFRNAMRLIMEFCASRVFDPLYRFKLDIARQARANEKMIKKVIADVYEKRKKEGLDEGDTDLLAQMMRADQQGAEWITKFTKGDKWRQFQGT
jgi:cytochrome P450